MKIPFLTPKPKPVPSGLLGVVASHKGITAGVAAVVLGGVVAVGAALEDGPVEATVVEVLTGDAVAVSYDGQTREVRLLNLVGVDDLECLTDEARDHLSGLLPEGTSVELTHDGDKEYEGTEYAGVFVGERLINAEVAAAGFGIAVEEPTERFYEEVHAAQLDAAAAEAGIYAADGECTASGILARYEDDADAVRTSAASLDVASETEMEKHQALVVAATERGSAAQALLGGDRSRLPLAAYTAEEYDSLVERYDATAATQDDARSVVDEAVAQEKARVEAEAAAKAAAEKAAAEAAEAERLAAEEAERKAAEERAAAEAAEAARQQEEAASAPSAAVGGTDPDYGTCKAAIAAGAGPYVAGVHPEYGWYQDRDGDGVVCER